MVARAGRDHHSPGHPNITESGLRPGDDGPRAGCAEVARHTDRVRVAGRNRRIAQARAIGDQNLGRVAIVAIEVDLDRVRVGRVEDEVARDIQQPVERTLNVFQTNEIRLVDVSEDRRVDVVTVQVERPLDLVRDLVGLRPRGAFLRPVEVDRPILAMELGSLVGSQLWYSLSVTMP